MFFCSLSRQRTPSEAPPMSQPGRKRSLTPRKQQKLCRLVARGATVAEAADEVGVSLRTVQREVSREE
ncbi:MAG: helix-turn-helix domain-containing protein, partial [Pirellulales bacterium]|nr:helix-turn-helix domain-containing protein [Pirellulales bacterium]